MSGTVTWTDAKAYAQAMGGYLAVITSAAENQKVNALLDNSGIVNCWYGAERTSGSWKWVNGETFKYTDWAPNEPNNSGGAENYLGRYGAQWNDFSVDSPNVFGFLVEINRPNA